MKLILRHCLLAALSVLVACSEVNVELSLVGRTLMQAVITNAGPLDLNLFNRATLLIDSPVQKVFMSANGTLLPFEGISFTPPALGNYTADSFTHLPIGNSLSVRFDSAEEYDLTAGGNFTAIAIGSMPYAEGTSTVLKGDSVAYRSNPVEMHIERVVNDTVLTARARFDKLSKGIDVRNDCEGGLRARVEHAIIGEGGCTKRADDAADDARSDEASHWFKAIFHSSDRVYMDRVADRFDAVADHCEVIGPAQIKFHCTDILGDCTLSNAPSPWAYSLDYYHLICLCDPALNIPTLTNDCHDMDMAGLVIHELTHLSTVFDPPTRDFASSWPYALMLPPEYASENADTYRLYAQAIANNCPVESFSAPAAPMPT